MKQLLCHLFGDYILQSDWEANEKTKRALPAAIHATKYAVAFTPATRNVKALVTIGATHYVIDRYRLAKHVSWAKNQCAPVSHRYTWEEGKQNGGYSNATPPWMSTWLMIISDNAIHMAINAAAIKVFEDQ